MKIRRLYPLFSGKKTLSPFIPFPHACLLAFHLPAIMCSYEHFQQRGCYLSPIYQSNYYITRCAVFSSETDIWTNALTTKFQSVRTNTIYLKFIKKFFLCVQKGDALLSVTRFAHLSGTLREAWVAVTDGKI